MGSQRVGHDWVTEHACTNNKIVSLLKKFIFLGRRHIHKGWFCLFVSVFIYFNWRLITLQYCSGFCHTLTWISHECTSVPHPEPLSHLPPHPIPQGCPSASVLSALFHSSNLDWWFISHMVIYMFQCYSLKLSHTHLLPQSPKVCSLHLRLFCGHKIVVTIFLNSTHIC